MAGFGTAYELLMFGGDTDRDWVRSDWYTQYSEYRLLLNAAKTKFCDSEGLETTIQLFGDWESTSYTFDAARGVRRTAYTHSIMGIEFFTTI